MSGTGMISGTGGSKHIMKGEVRERKQNYGRSSKWGASTSSYIGESSMVADVSADFGFQTGKNRQLMAEKQNFVT